MSGDSNTPISPDAEHEIQTLVNRVADLIHCTWHEETCWTCGAEWTGCSCGAECGFASQCDDEKDAHEALAELAARVR